MTVEKHMIHMESAASSPHKVYAQSYYIIS
jgi:hypothetical protein